MTPFAPAATSVRLPKPELREARFGDRDSVIALMRRNGLQIQSATGNWQWLWRDNPAMTVFDGPWPIGWVLESEIGITGYLGNVPLLYRFKGKVLRIAAARGFAVDPGARGHSLRLAAAYFSQTGADLLLNTSANAAAASVWKLCKALSLPQAEYEKVLLWILKDRKFLESYLRKLGKPGWLATLAGFILAPVVSAEGFVRHRKPAASSSGAAVSTLEPDQIDGEFDLLWASILKARPGRLLADRSATSLRWHFGSGNTLERRPKVLAVRRGGLLAGYAVITREDSEHLRLKRSRISDLMAKDDDITVIDDLLGAAHVYALAEGSHALELVGYPEFIRARALAGNPHIYRLPAPPYWYKAVDASLASDLGREQSWYGSPYDGDATL